MSLRSPIGTSASPVMTGTWWLNASTYWQILATCCGCHTLRPLGRGLVELRFDMSRRSWRITYWHRPDGVIVLLTVFHKQRDNEAREVAPGT